MAKKQSVIYSDEQVAYVRGLYPELSAKSGDYVMKHHLMALDANIPRNKSKGGNMRPKVS